MRVKRTKVLAKRACPWLASGHGLYSQTLRCLHAFQKPAGSHLGQGEAEVTAASPSFSLVNVPQSPTCVFPQTQAEERRFEETGFLNDEVSSKDVFLWAGPRMRPGYRLRHFNRSCSECACGPDVGHVAEGLSPKPLCVLMGRFLLKRVLVLVLPREVWVR